IAGHRIVVSPVAVAPALLSRAVAGAEITELDGKLATLEGAAATRLRQDIVARSIAARVISSQTSMLVLESDADYMRYGIERKTLADILTIGPTGVELTHRTAPAQVQIATPPPTTKKQKSVDRAGKDGRRESDDQDGAKDTKQLDDTLARSPREADETNRPMAKRLAREEAKEESPDRNAPPAAEPRAERLGNASIRATGRGAAGSSSGASASSAAAPAPSVM